MAIDDLKVPVEKLRWVCNTDQFDFETTEDLPDLEDTIGQE